MSRLYFHAAFVPPTTDNTQYMRCWSCWTFFWH